MGMIAAVQGAPSLAESWGTSCSWALPLTPGSPPSTQGPASRSAEGTALPGAELCTEGMELTQKPKFSGPQTTVSPPRELQLYWHKRQAIGLSPAWPAARSTGVCCSAPVLPSTAALGSLPPTSAGCSQCPPIPHWMESRYDPTGHLSLVPLPSSMLTAVLLHTAGSITLLVPQGSHQPQICFSYSYFGLFCSNGECHKEQ